MKQRKYKKTKYKLFGHLLNTRCPNCHERGPHWISVGEENFMLPYAQNGGFWTCPKLYDENGIRID